MNRRTFLAVGGTVALGGLAGCLGGNSAANEYEYKMKTTNGVAVPLAPVDDVYEWYENDDARFADARGRAQYEELRVADAVFSPAPDGTENDPVEEWSTDTQIVTYCRCPHHLSTQRAASLIAAGYEHTYAIDEGFGAWITRGYPMAGTAVETQQNESNDSASASEATSDVQVDYQRYEIHGRTRGDTSGMVTLEQVGVDRREAAPIAADGSFTLQLHYAGSSDDRFRVEVDGNSTVGTLAELTSAPVTV